jgi:hypothetical protein
MIMHIALFAWKPGVTMAQEAALGCRLIALRDLVPGILNISFGHQNSPEGLGKDFNAGLSVVFTDAQARDAYLPHPAHQEVVADLLPLLADVVVVDYDMVG